MAAAMSSSPAGTQSPRPRRWSCGRSPSTSRGAPLARGPRSRSPNRGSRGGGAGERAAASAAGSSPPCLPSRSTATAPPAATTAAAPRTRGCRSDQTHTLGSVAGTTHTLGS
eukprot:9303939-Pyramimonas_sp.AAC.1